MPRQPVPVLVFSQTYTLLTDNDPAEVHEIASQIDELMVSIASRSSSGDSTRVAVLACFHLADKLREAQQKLRLFEAKSEHIGTLLEEALEQA